MAPTHAVAQARDLHVSLGCSFSLSLQIQSRTVLELFHLKEKETSIWLLVLEPLLLPLFRPWLGDPRPLCAASTLLTVSLAGSRHQVTPLVSAEVMSHVFQAASNPIRY